MFDRPYQPDPGVKLGEHHRWEIDGKPAPGITEILTYSGWIKTGADESYLHHGSVVHKGIEWSLDPEFDFDAFAQKYPDAAPQVEAGRKALAFFQVKRGWQEIWVCCRRRHVCSAIDAIGRNEQGHPGTINFKSGEEQDWHSIQAAGEAALFFKDDFYDLEQPTFRSTATLQRDGSFDPKRDVTYYTDPRDFDLFDAACITTEGMKRKGRNERPQPKFTVRAKEKVIAVESTLFQGDPMTTGEGGLFG